jgi:hypothetical protein
MMEFGQALVDKSRLEHADISRTNDINNNDDNETNAGSARYEQQVDLETESDDSVREGEANEMEAEEHSSRAPSPSPTAKPAEEISHYGSSTSKASDKLEKGNVKKSMTPGKEKKPKSASGLPAKKRGRPKKVREPMPKRKRGRPPKLPRIEDWKDLLKTTYLPLKDVIKHNAALTRAFAALPSDLAAAVEAHFLSLTDPEEREKYIVILTSAVLDPPPVTNPDSANAPSLGDSGTQNSIRTSDSQCHEATGGREGGPNGEPSFTPLEAVNYGENQFEICEGHFSSSGQVPPSHYNPDVLETTMTAINGNGSPRRAPSQNAGFPPENYGGNVADITIMLQIYCDNDRFKLITLQRFEARGGAQIAPRPDVTSVYLMIISPSSTIYI